MTINDLKNKTHSIDAVVDRVQLLAGNINEMTHIVSIYFFCKHLEL